MSGIKDKLVVISGATSGIGDFRGAAGMRHVSYAMTKAKRHHWWPMAQSVYWTNSDGFVSVTRSDGAVFPANPLNIGVESELYTRFSEERGKGTGIEEWFAQAIDGPAKQMIEHLLDPRNVHRSLFLPDPSKAKVATALGCRVNRYIDKVELPPEIRKAIARYLAALLVRHPTYLGKLVTFHAGGTKASTSTKDRALDNMIQLYDVYTKRISTAVFMISRRVGDAEYLYADGGLMVEEPWRHDHDIPFDIHAPLTPDIAIEVLPMPLTVVGSNLTSAIVMEIDQTRSGTTKSNYSCRG
jgi:hypothetical protein